MDYLTDEQIHDESVDLARYRLVFLQHVRGEDRDHYERLLLSAKNRNADLRVIAISAYSASPCRSWPNAGWSRTIPSFPPITAV